MTVPAMPSRPRLALTDDELVMNPDRRVPRTWPLTDVAAILPELHPDLELTSRGLSFVEAPFVRVILRRGRVLRIRVATLDHAVEVTRAWRTRAPDDARAFEHKLVKRALDAETTRGALMGKQARRLTMMTRMGAVTLVLGMMSLAFGRALGMGALMRDMGRGMAANLLKAGFVVNVWNRTASRVDPLVTQGATVGANQSRAEIHGRSGAAPARRTTSRRSSDRSVARPRSCRRAR